MSRPIHAPLADLRRGHYRHALADVGACHAIITDPPYSARTHAGFRSGDPGSTVAYPPITRPRVNAAVRDLARLRPDWWVVFGDHVSWQWWAAALARIELYVFAPVIWIGGRRPRLTGEGPSSDAEYLCVARRRARVAPGSRPGHYLTPPERASELVGQKPVALMRALVRDYTRPGDVIVDPFAGSGTTLLAARLEGRHAYGAERDPTTAALARARLEAPYTPDWTVTHAVG